MTSAAVAVLVTLVGVSSALGQTAPDFEDVPEGHAAESAIKWAAENVITVGVGDNRFGIGQTLTRYQMVTFLCRAFDPDSCQSGVRGSDRFDDVPADHWANYSVGWAVDHGITTGVSATEFAGTQTLTREQMITFLYRAKGSPTGGSNGSDVYQDAPDRSHWANLPIGWAYDQGVTGGIAAGTFGFGTNVSREEMVLFLCRTVAAGTCQPSQQPLPSSVVPTSTTGKDDSDTTGADDAENTEPELYLEDEEVVSEDDEAILGLYSWATYNKGIKPVHVFYCARQGKYTNEDLAEVVDLLNDELSPRWVNESSNLLTLIFTEGSIISPDLA